MYNFRIYFNNETVIDMLYGGDFSDSGTYICDDDICYLKANLWIHLMEKQGYVHGTEYDLEDFLKHSMRCMALIKKINKRELIFDEIGNLSF